MKEDLQEKMFNWLSQAAVSIADWSAKEVPLFVKEFLTWKFYENLLGIIFWLIGAILVSVLITFFYKKIWKPFTRFESRVFGILDTEIASIITAILSLVLLVLTLRTIPFNEIKNCVQIKVAPKVFLLENAAAYIKKN